MSQSRTNYPRYRSGEKPFTCFGCDEQYCIKVVFTILRNRRLISLELRWRIVNELYNNIDEHFEIRGGGSEINFYVTKINRVSNTCVCLKSTASVWISAKLKTLFFFWPHLGYIYHLICLSCAHLTGKLIMIEKLVLGEIWTGDHPIFKPDALTSVPSWQADISKKNKFRETW